MTKLENIPYTRWFWWTLIALVAIRITILLFATPNLGPDETQYWFWAQTPDFGYFSKPPLIAWIIALSTSLFGNDPWAVRLPAVLCHAVVAGFLFALTTRKFGDQAGFYVGIGWLTLPGVTLSSTLIATDAPMLACWSAGLYYFFKIVDEKSPRPALDVWALGLAIGAGMLAKYAMIYFVIGASLCILTVPSMRKFIPHLLGAFATALVVFSPNIIWNMQHDFSTLNHTSANANWSGRLFDVAALGDFLVGQFGVAGPVMILLIASALFCVVRETEPLQNRQLKPFIFFIAPPLIVITIQAFISRAHANWAAAAYPAALIIASVWFLTQNRRKWLRASIGLHLTAFIIFAGVIVNPAFADKIGFAGTLKRLRGWEAHGSAISEIAREHGIHNIMADDREILGGLTYYVGGTNQFFALNSNHKIDHHFEAFHSFEKVADKPILFITTHADALEVIGRFSAIEANGKTTADLGAGRTRTLFIFKVSGFKN